MRGWRPEAGGWRPLALVVHDPTSFINIDIVLFASFLSTSTVGLMDIALDSHPASPGSIPGWGRDLSTTFPKYFFISRE